MDVDVARLRETFAAKSSEELRRVVESADGQYTAEAVMVAKELLASRPPDSAPPGDAVENAPAGSSEMWSGVGAMLCASYVAKLMFRAWREAEKDPHAMQQALFRLTVSPWTYVLIVMVGIWVWRRTSRAA